MLNGNLEAFKEMIKGKKVSVLGIGISNVPALRFLSDCGAVITACDRKTEDKMDFTPIRCST